MIPTHLAAALIAALAAWFFQGYRYGAQLADLHRDHAVAVRKAEEQAREAEQAINTKYQEAINAATTRESVLRRHATAARNESDSLRAQLTDAARRFADAPPAAVIEYAATTNELLTDCSRRYQELGAQADGHANDVRTLTEAWPVNLTSSDDRQ